MDAATDAAWSQAARERMQALDAQLAVRFDRGDATAALTAARARGIDALVREAWARCIPESVDAALFAVGGYGRSSLYPQSDVDLLVLTEQAWDHAVGEAISRCVALLWDARIPVSHSVRSQEETVAAARDDITTVTALMDARLLAGSRSAVATLADAIAPERSWPPAEYFAGKREELRARHARFDDTADNLEPNIKEGPGGLRDLQTLRWMAMRVLGATGLDALESLGQVGHIERETLENAAVALQRLRYGLHLVAGKREERLRFDHQRALAARMNRVGHADLEPADNAMVEAMMQEFYRNAARVQRIGDRLLQRFEEQLEGEAIAEPIDDQFELRRGYITARDPAWPMGDTARIFELFATWAHTPAARGLHSRTARALAEVLRNVPAYSEASPELRQRFMALLTMPGAVATLERMARLGVLARWIPAFAQVTGRMQFDLFHTYTVDQHTLALLRNFALFASSADTQRFARAHEVWPHLRKPELLLLAGLFHDIAKGRGGDHSILGAEDARVFCTAHGLSDADTALVAWLVEQHLTMSVTAQKQDISDAEVVQKFARLVGDRERLDYLYLLTCADIAATSPKLWNAWKDRLLGDLHVATRLALRRGGEDPVAAEARIAEAQTNVGLLLDGMGRNDDGMRWLPNSSFLHARVEQLTWMALQLSDMRAGETRIAARHPVAGDASLELLVHTPDRPGLFAAIVATLDRIGLDVLHARLLDAPQGQVIDSFVLMPRDSKRAVESRDVERRLGDVLSHPLDQVKPARHARPSHLRHFRIAPQIEFSEDHGRTVLAIVCNDRPGLLADIAQQLLRQRFPVHDARIATFGERAEDVFRISQADGQPLDSVAQEALRDALSTILQGDHA
ncbi:[protein-PII] uridylyltransferase [Solilutibacter silvestris]|uniref:Bifunctional uridylyltransferase/uridylyl-removing enzyme n=1 Tax=Solilutibacter silvestris TaxID=1645665 RepID=A0A2K1Q3H9_9GAMM|nr:[protein-PII] uridylyltransferase [Lysobacter silvestris]PNS09561.1 protein-P-II uridylyltransferase [Lysobacter silvestris]